MVALGWATTVADALKAGEVTDEELDTLETALQPLTKHPRTFVLRLCSQHGVVATYSRSRRSSSKPKSQAHSLPPPLKSTTSECIEYLLHYFKTGDRQGYSAYNVTPAYNVEHAKVLAELKGGVCPKDVAAAAELSKIFGVMVTVDTIIHYEKSETGQGKTCFVPSIEGLDFHIAPTTCAKKLGPRAIMLMHGFNVSDSLWRGRRRKG